MGDSASSVEPGDDAEDDDAETKEDFEDFKSWLDKRDGSDTNGKDAVMVAAAPPPPSEPKGEVCKVKWICELCKGDATSCH